MTTILITNDDGITSPGITALEKAMQPLGTTVIVAPDDDNSGVSHCLTLKRPLRLTRYRENRYSVNGTPADCVILSLDKILSEPPSLVVSGINPGPNLGDDIHYSGTVAAAIEASMHGIPAIAFSATAKEAPDFNSILPIIEKIARQILIQPLPPQNILNVNFPYGGEERKIRITRQGRRLWKNGVHKTEDPKGNPHYWIGGGTASEARDNDTDVEAYASGYISLTPIQLDCTNYHLLKSLRLEKEKMK